MKDYKNKTPQDLAQLIASKRGELRGFRFGSTGSKIKNVKLARTIKKDVARIMTELSMRRLNIKGTPKMSEKAAAKTK